MQNIDSVLLFCILFCILALVKKYADAIFNMQNMQKKYATPNFYMQNSALSVLHILHTYALPSLLMVLAPTRITVT